MISGNLCRPAYCYCLSWRPPASEMACHSPVGEPDSEPTIICRRQGGAGSTTHPSEPSVEIPIGRPFIISIANRQRVRHPFGGHKSGSSPTLAALASRTFYFPLATLWTGMRMSFALAKRLCSAHSDVDYPRIDPFITSSLGIVPARSPETMLHGDLVWTESTPFVLGSQGKRGLGILRSFGRRPTLRAWKDRPPGAPVPTISARGA